VAGVFRTGLSRDNGLMAFSLFTWGTGEGLFFYIQPLVLRDMGADPVAIGSILALAALAAGLSHIPTGYLADRFGRKPILVAGWTLGLLTCVLMFAARDLRVFVPALVAFTFTGFVVAPINGYVAAARGTQTVQRALTMVSAAFWAGTVVSPAIGGFIATTFSVRTVFGVAAVIFTVSTAAMLLLSSQPRLAPPPGERRYGALLGNRQFLGFLLLTLSALLAIQIGLPLMPNFVAEVRGLEVGVVGALGSVASLGAVAFNLIIGRLRAPRRGLMLGQAMIVLAMALLVTASAAPWLVLAYFFRAGWQVAHNMAVAQVSRVVSTTEIGLALGLTETASAIALVLGPLLAGVLYTASPFLPFQASLALTALTLPLVWRFAPRRDAHSLEAAPHPAGD
jgi:MFS family permease